MLEDDAPPASKKEETFLKKMRRNKGRIMIQETCKGLAKGLNLSSFVLKGLVLSGDNWLYFVLSLMTRGMMSALIKAFSLAYVFRIKNLKLKKCHMNLIYHVLPSLTLFFVLSGVKAWIERDDPVSNDMTVHVF